VKHGGGLAPGLRLLLLVFMLSGCAQPSVLLRDKSPKSGPGPVKVLLMPPDVELSELTAGGLLEPKAEWTERAREHIQGALSRELVGLEQL